MPTCSYRELVKVCAALGLEPIRSRNGTKWIGISPLNRRAVFLVVHTHATGRDLPVGLFRHYVSRLGFQSVDHFRHTYTACVGSGPARGKRSVNSEVAFVAISVRPYGRPGDFDLVGRFLIKHYLPANRDGNWLQPMWEYMHSHPGLNAAVLDHIGVWEDGGELAGVVNYETDLGEAFFQLSPGHAGLKPEMLRYAEERLAGSPRDAGNKILRAYIFEHDHELAAIARSRGFRREEGRGRPMARLEIRGPIAVPDLAGGFRLKSLADENDLRKIHRVMWRGFNHPGEPPEEGLVWRLQMQSGPNFKKDLNIVVEAPDGSFVSYAGLWYEPSNRIAYVEPVVTDPDYRRMGLGRAAVLEGIRRCAARGATAAYVGSWQAFYLGIGFTKLFRHLCWIKQFGPSG